MGLCAGLESGGDAGEVEEREAVALFVKEFCAWFALDTILGYMGGLASSFVLLLY